MLSREYLSKPDNGIFNLIGTSQEGRVSERPEDEFISTSDYIWSVCYNKYFFSKTIRFPNRETEILSGGEVKKREMTTDQRLGRSHPA